MADERDSARFSLAQDLPIRPGATIGRFSVLRSVGEGSMGRVFEAYDPSLERRVALKLLHASGDGSRKDRLAREARALAKLAHPNVVKVHDVDVHQGALFLTMEFVAGNTLADWIREHPIGDSSRTQTAIQILIGAGRGLAAAHAAGLVHRDIKPTNILIGHDLRPRVADFGVTFSEPVANPHVVDFETLESDAAATVTNSRQGTPAYAAPELSDGGQGGAYADQFSYCVTAWETLFGVRPYPETSPQERLEAIQSGRLERPGSVELPMLVERLLRQGLQFDPQDRHREFSEIVQQLELAVEAHPPQTRRAWWKTGVLVGGVGSVLVASVYQSERLNTPCSKAAERYALVWNDDRRDEVRFAFHGSGLEFAPKAWARLEAGLDEYERDWQEKAKAVCDAGIVRGEKTPAAMAGELACLDAARQSVDVLLNLVDSGTARFVASDRELLEELPALAHCNGAKETLANTDRDTLISVQEARYQRAAGDTGVALRSIETLAASVGQRAPARVRAQVLWEHGKALAHTSRRRAAVPHLERAYEVSNAGGLTQLAAAIAHDVTLNNSALLTPPETNRVWLDRAKDADPMTSKALAELRGVEGMLSILEGEEDQALEQFGDAVDTAIAEPTLAPEMRRRLASQLHARGVNDERAVREGRAALKAMRDELGESHPRLGSFETTLANLLTRPEDQTEAERLARSGLERATDTWGSEHSARHGSLVQLARIVCREPDGRPEGASLAQAAVDMTPSDEPSMDRFDGLGALRACLASSELSRATEVSSERVQVASKLFGEKHRETVRERAIYALALVRASEADRAWEQTTLAASLMDEGVADWDPRGAIEIRRTLGSVAGMVGEMEMSLRQAEAALRVVQESRELGRTAETSARQSLCHAYISVGKLEQALTECSAALNTADSDLVVSRLELMTATVFIILGRNEEALPHLRTAIRLFEKVDGPSARSVALGHRRLGEAYEGLQRYREAEEHYRTSVTVYEGLGGVAQSQIASGAGLARMVAINGDPKEARKLLDGFEGISSQADPFQKGFIAESRGFLAHLRDDAAGRRDYERALDFFRVGGGETGMEVLQLCREAPFPLTSCSPPNHGK